MCWAFEQLGWSEVIHRIDTANLASIAVAERLGSRLLRAEGADVQIYGQTRQQWRDAGQTALDQTLARMAGEGGERK